MVYTSVLDVPAVILSVVMPIVISVCRFIPPLTVISAHTSIDPTPSDSGLVSVSIRLKVTTAPAN